MYRRVDEREDYSDSEFGLGYVNRFDSGIP